MSGPIRLERGDITRVAADAVVNASNAHMSPGGGVSGAIHAAAGPTVADESAALLARRGPLAPGEAAATGAGRLPARYVIHALGPVWRGGAAGEPEQLASAYRESVRVADELGCRTIAFPSISTGIFGYPVLPAARIALATVRDALGQARNVREALFVLYDERTYASYEQALAELEREANG